MTFLQPWMFWALPLVLLPVLIHLLNRLRHRPQPWAAMRFLLFATRTSTSQAKLRQFLILLMRVLALLALLFFLARPLAGGWLGWALAPAPDVIVLMLDRSASMQTKLSEGGETRLEQGLRVMVEAARPFEGSSQLVWMDNTGRAPSALTKLSEVEALKLGGPTETAADVPSMLQAALRWLLDNKSGTAEVWLASDMQKSNWRPDDSRWGDLTAQLAGLPQKVRVRILPVLGRSGPNRSVRLEESYRRKRGGKGELAMTLDFLKTEPVAESIPVGVTLNSSRTDVEVALDSQESRWRHAVGLDIRQGRGWGKVEVPADTNPSDNAAYFVYSEDVPLRAAVSAREAISERVLGLAATAFGQATNGAPRPVKPDVAGGWERETLVIWQGALPQGSPSEELRRWVQEGGVVVFFPPGLADTNRFEGIGWGEVQNALEAKPFRVVKWDENQGPLARTDEGSSLPMGNLMILKRQAVVGGGTVLAPFEDGAPFLARQVLGRGEIYFCASLPEPTWSGLAEGPVLVPMLQRLLALGARRLQHDPSVICGEMGVADAGLTWTAVEGAGLDARFRAGVYQSRDRLLAVNRSPLEDDWEAVEGSAAANLLGPDNARLWEGKTSGGAGATQGEIWRFFLAGMLLFLLVEGWLILPGAGPSSAAGSARSIRVEGGGI